MKLNILAVMTLCIGVLLTGPLIARASCSSGDDCNTGHVCIGPAGEKSCYQSCTEGSTTCVAPKTCGQVTGFTPRVCVETCGAVQCPFGQICGGPSENRTCYKACAADNIVPCPGEKTCGQLAGLTKTVCIDSPAGQGTAEPPAEVPFVPITPILGVAIPGADLSAPTNEGGVVRVAFFAQYVNAAYKYLTGIILVVAIVMCVYGGFLYLVGSAGVGSIQRGKSIIVNSIIGMLITLGGYAILNTVNPDTTNLKVLELSFVKTDTWAEGEIGSEFSEPTVARPAGTPFAPTELANLGMCAQLMPYINNGTISIPLASDRAGLSGGTGFIRRSSSAEWCQSLSDRRATSCPGLPTTADFTAASQGKSSRFDDAAEGVAINPMICRFLLDLAIAKTSGEISGVVSAKLVGMHHRCADGAWFFRDAVSNNNCTTLAKGRRECIACVRSIVGGGTAGQSAHWTGEGFDMINNDSVQRYAVNVLSARYKAQNGGRAVFADVFGGNIEPHTGTVNCSSREGRIQTGAWCVDGNCGTADHMVGVGVQTVCGHYSGGKNSHLHISFK